MDGPLFDEELNCRCRVCGFDFGAPQWGEDGRSPTYSICVCCGAEAGYQDFTLNGIRNHRQRWLDAGAPFADKKFMPKDWNLEEQMAQIPERFR